MMPTSQFWRNKTLKNDFRYQSTDVIVQTMAEAWANGEHNYSWVLEGIQKMDPIRAAVVAIEVHRELVSFDRKLWQKAGANAKLFLEYLTLHQSK